MIVISFYYKILHSSYNLPTCTCKYETTLIYKVFNLYKLASACTFLLPRINPSWSLVNVPVTQTLQHQNNTQETHTCIIWLPWRPIMWSIWGFVDNKFRNNPSVFIRTTSGSDNNRKIWSVPNAWRIWDLIFCSAWNAMFWGEEKQWFYAENLNWLRLQLFQFL